MIQARCGNLNRQHLGTLQIIVTDSFQRGGLTTAGLLDSLNNAFGIPRLGICMLLQHTLNARDRMFGQQLQHTDVLPNPSTGTMPCFQSCPQPFKDRRQFPMPVEIGMIQSSRTTSQRDQVVPGIQNLIPLLIAAGMFGDETILPENLDAGDKSLNGHTLKGTLPGNAVMNVVKADKLILVDLGFLADTGFEGILGQGCGPLLFLLQTRANRLCLSTAAALLFLETTFSQKGIQFFEILHLGNGS